MSEGEIGTKSVVATAEMAAAHLGAAAGERGRIAVDLRRVANVGIGRYMRCLFPPLVRMDLLNEYVFLVPRGIQLGIDLGQSRLIGTSIPYYSLKEQFQLPLLLRRLSVDLFHSPHFVLPLIRPCKSIVTIHDVVYLEYPQDLSLRGRIYYAASIRMAARRASQVVTVSEFSKRELIRRLAIPPERVCVVTEAPAKQFSVIDDPLLLGRVRRKYSLPRRFFFHIGIQRPRKNLTRIVLAFCRLASAVRRPDLQLILGGREDPGFEDVERLVKDLGMSENIRIIREIPEGDLPAIYSLARGLVFPSLYEGFGLPVLEAMACGTPVITSNRGALLEVSGGAALLVDPTSVTEISDAMGQLLDDHELFDTLRRKGLSRASQYSWETAAEQTLNVYRALLGQRPSGECQ